MTDELKSNDRRGFLGGLATAIILGSSGCARRVASTTPVEELVTVDSRFNQARAEEIYETFLQTRDAFDPAAAEAIVARGDISEFDNTITELEALCSLAYEQREVAGPDPNDRHQACLRFSEIGYFTNEAARRYLQANLSTDEDSRQDRAYNLGLVLMNSSTGGTCNGEHVFRGFPTPMNVASRDCSVADEEFTEETSRMWRELGGSVSQYFNGRRGNEIAEDHIEQFQAVLERIQDPRTDLETANRVGAHLFFVAGNVLNGIGFYIGRQSPHDPVEVPSDVAPLVAAYANVLAGSDTRYKC